MTQTACQKDKAIRHTQKSTTGCTTWIPFKKAGADTDKDSSFEGLMRERGP